MRFRTFLVTGVEVLHLGGQHFESNQWGSDHWKENKGRWRLATSAIDAYVTKEIRRRRYSPTVEGFVLALEVADFASWPVGTFVRPDRPPSYKPKHRDLWSFGKLDWRDVQMMTLTQQYGAFRSCALAAVARIRNARRMPREFDLDAFEMDLADAFSRGKPSQFAYSAVRHQSRRR